MEAILKVRKDKDTAWTPLPNPKSMEYGLQDLDSEDGAGRNQQGLMFRDRVATKRKLTCQWPPMDGEKLSTILSAIEHVFFEIEFPDAKTGKRDVMTVYVGDRTSPMYTIREDGTWIWNGLSANFVER